MNGAVRLLPRQSDPPETEDLSLKVRLLQAEREALLELLAHQQRVAQAGLVTSGLAHDVDNHVQIITGAVFLARQQDDPDEWKRTLDKVQSQCCALTETTRAFLGFVRRQTTYGQGRFEAGKAIAESIRLTQPLGRKHDVELEPELDDNAVVRGERRLVVQALVNLVTNAIRACAGRDDARIVLRVSRTAPGWSRIEVSDNGPGIPQDIRRYLFRPFACGREDGGNGLGLFIVRQNVRRLGGEIRIRSSAEGTTFRVDLPCEDEA